MKILVLAQGYNIFHEHVAKKPKPSPDPSIFTTVYLSDFFTIFYIHRNSFSNNNNFFSAFSTSKILFFSIHVKDGILLDIDISE